MKRKETGMKNKIQKVPAIEIKKMGGLKCDNPECDWKDNDIKVGDYKEYINFSCPKCGENVFTEKDYKSFKFLMGLVKFFNFILPKRIPNKDKDATMTCEFNGKGEVKTNIQKNK